MARGKAGVLCSFLSGEMARRRLLAYRGSSVTLRQVGRDARAQQNESGEAEVVRAARVRSERVPFIAMIVRRS
jgi:hypothetical protein